MRKRHFATPSDGPPSRMAKRSAGGGSDDRRRSAPAEAPDDQAVQQLVESFAAEEASLSSTAASRVWIKGGTVQPGAGEVNAAAGRVYAPQSRYRPTSNPLEEARQQPQAEPAAKPSRRIKQETVTRKTNLELFKDELKAMQEKREQRKQLMQQEQQHKERSSSRFDPPPNEPPPRPPSPIRSELSLDPSEFVSQYDYDKDTTNLFLGNLNPEMTETQLMELFGRYGPLASVKIMWPRTDAERSKRRNCGFVAFMCRRDAERAEERLRERDIMGYDMKIGWGKCVPIPTYPIYVPPLLQETIDPPPRSGLPFNAQPREWLDAGGAKSERRRRRRKPLDTGGMTQQELQELIADSVVKVVMPADRGILSTINRCVEHVVREGHAFEAMVMEREGDNPRFRFLFDYASAEHTYYRWRLYSILHGDTAKAWRLQDFRMYKGGSLWRPPPMNVFTSGMPEHLVDEADVPFQKAEREASPASPPPTAAQPGNSKPPGERPLSDAARAELEQLLEGVTTKRMCIAEAMVWCLDRAECAAEIVQALAAAASADSAPTERRLATLFLVSDILHNSAARLPCASHFRQRFQPTLPALFRSLNPLLDVGLAVRQQASLVLRAWEEWALYEREFLMRLNNAFLGLTSGQPILAEVAAADVKDAEEDPALDGQPLPGLVDYDGDPLVDADIDGQPLGQAAPKSKWSAVAGAHASLVSYDSDDSGQD